MFPNNGRELYLEQVMNNFVDVYIFCEVNRFLFSAHGDLAYY